jgi:hypothetical protein
MLGKVTLWAGLVAATLAFAAAAAASPQTARIAGACSVGTGEGYGYTYLTSLTVKNTTCTIGKTLVRHKGHLAGWHCSKKTLQSSPTQYVARESCSSGAKRVTYIYTQNT